MSYEVLGQRVVVINSAKIATEIFEKRSTIYSDRPSFHMAAGLMKWDWNMVFLRYSEKWRLYRRTFHQYFNANESPTFHPIQMNATVAFLKFMLKSPDQFFAHTRNQAGSIILRIIYGYDTQSSQNEFVEVADKALRAAFYGMTPGGYVVDYLPMVKYLPSWLPFTQFQHDAKLAARTVFDMVHRPFTQLAVQNPLEIPCFVSTTMDRIQRDGEDNNAMTMTKELAGVAFAGGADTTVSVTLTTIMAMAKHPEVQIRAQKELDDVVGRERVPTFEDRENLPFISAIFLESMRWRPVLNLGVAHSNTSDDVYDGYLIPAHSIVFGNTWSILHDENVYHDAQAYNPARFMGPNPEPDPTTSGAFGRATVEDTAFIAIACILWAFNFSPAKDEDGKDIEIDDMAYTDALVVHPMPFKCEIVSRFPTVAEVVDATETFA